MNVKVLIMLIIIILIVLIFYLINKYLYLKYTYINEKINTEETNNIDIAIARYNAKETNNIDIVIARYNEDLKWTLEYPFNKYKYIVYNKGDNEYFEKKNVIKIVNLPNVGKCDHTYLNHIITNYNNLSEINVFLPGSLDMHYKKPIAVKLLMEIEKRQKAVFISSKDNKINYNFKMNNYTTKNVSNRIKNPEVTLKKSSIRPFGLWFNNIFGNIKINCLIYYGIFSIHKNDIIQHPVSRYESLIKDLSNHSNPEVGHYIERSWCAIFHPIKNTHIIYEKIGKLY